MKRTAGRWFLLRMMPLTLLAAGMGVAWAVDPDPGSGSPDTAPSEKSEILDTLESRPRRSLAAYASQRRDYLANTESWVLKPNYTLHKLLELPSWASLSIEERIRYETYGTPWIRNTTQGQWSTPLASVVFGEVRPTENFRLAAEFWDARQWGPADPNRLNTSMVNALNFTQIYAAGVSRKLWDSDIDGELKGGQMTLSLGSTRLIGRYAFRNTQQSYVGLQGRLRENNGQWELLTFANVPENLLPSTRAALIDNQAVWNRPMTDAYFWGGFLTRHWSSHDRLEIYFYDLQQSTSSRQLEQSYTPGIRVYREVVKGAFDYEIETVGQTGVSPLGLGGSGVSQRYNGVMEHLQLGYSWDLPWKPRLTLEWDYASANFNPLFGISVIDFGPSGILNLFKRSNLDSPGIRYLMTPDPDIFMYLVYREIWLANGRAAQGWSAANLADPTGTSGTHIGQTIELAGRWDLAYNLAFQAGWQVLMKGRFAENAPGAPADHHDVNYFYIESQIRL
jgi:Alginate export